mgnify:CR=1 FL=1
MMNPHDLDLITSLYGYKDGFASSYSTLFNEKLESSASDEELELSSSEWEEEEVDPFMYYLAMYLFCYLF